MYNYRVMYESTKDVEEHLVRGSTVINHVRVEWIPVILSGEAEWLLIWPTLPVRPLYEQGSFLVLSG